MDGHGRRPPPADAAPQLRSQAARHATLAAPPAAAPQLPHAAYPGGPPLPPSRAAVSCGGLPDPCGMYAAAHRHRRERGVHAHGGAARKRASPSPPPVLLCFIGAVVLLANACHTVFPKEKVSFLGSLWRISLAAVAHTPTPKPQGVKYELHTLPVDAKAVTDGDTITVYVDTADPRESRNVPHEIEEVAAERTMARAAKNYQKADALQKIIVDAGYRSLQININQLSIRTGCQLVTLLKLLTSECRQVHIMRGEQVLAKKYRIRLRGIDAPENSMPYGKEAKEELVKLVQGRTLKISIYDTDRYGRLVGDVDCNGVFVQEHMLKKGLTWHYTAYDRRLEFAKWENQAQANRVGLWALKNPEKPWEWRKEKRMRKG